MTSFPVDQTATARFVRPLAVALVLALLLSLLPMTVFAQTGGAQVGPYIVTLQPGQKIEINVHGFCLNYGLPFPGLTLKPADLASDPLRNAAIYSLANSYVDTNAYDVQKAVWYLSDGTRLKNEDYTLADEIIEYANSGVQPADVVDGVPHMAAKLQDGSLQATVTDFVNNAPKLGSFFGNGTLTIINVSDAPQRFVVSYGTVAVDEVAGDQQNMLVFPSEPAPVTPTVPSTGALLPPIAIAAAVVAVAMGLGALGFGALGIGVYVAARH